MNCYDFDKTIFNGDSTALFILYLLKRHPALLRFVLGIGKNFIMYTLGKSTKTEFKQSMYTIFQYVPDIDAEVDLFWNKYQNRFKTWYLEQRREDDVIISASPEFLVDQGCKRIGIQCVMASVVDKKTGAYTGVNCDGEEKVRRFYERFPNGKIRYFYSDSLIDEPLAGISENAYIVKGEKIKKWPFEMKRRDNV